MDRRSFLALAAAGALADGVRLQGAPRRRYKAVAFDGLVIFDPRPVAALTESLFPGRGAAIGSAWRSRQFEYQWLRALGGRYADFLQCTEQGLRFAARQLDVPLTDAAAAQLVGAWQHLDVWADVPDALERLRSADLRVVMLSNMSTAMIADGLRRTGASPLFDVTLSTDAVQTFKPDPRAYALAADRLKLSRDEILFVPFAGWDVAGARWFGYPTFWVNRAAAPAEALDAVPDGAGPDLRALLTFALQ
jgi:2-haloacid dehalogenase